MSIHSSRSSTSSNIPLTMAIRSLPAQYGHVLSRPSIRTFAEEKENASWTSTWLQLVVLALLSALLTGLSLLIAPSQVASLPGISADTFRSTIIVASFLFVLVFTPLVFLAVSGVFYLLARLLKGDGSYLEQTYTLVLIGFPLALLSSLLLLIPPTSNWLPYLPHLYSLVLFFLALRAVHHLGGGRTLVVFLLFAILLLLLLGIALLTIIAMLPH